MIQPLEMKETHPIKLHAGGVSTTTDVWNALSASFDGDVDRVASFVNSNQQLLTCQYDYTSPAASRRARRSRRSGSVSHRTGCA